MQLLRKNLWATIFVCWLIALVATAGSLFLSQVMGYAPCVLCWYQRIAMYPLLIIFTVGLMAKTNEVHLYSLPLSIIGFLVALYHNLIQWEIIPEAASPCVQGVSCSTVFLGWLGFITIPLLSLTAFTLITSILLLSRKQNG